MFFILARPSFFASWTLLAVAICVSSCAAQEKKIAEDEFLSSTRAAWRSSTNMFPRIETRESITDDGATKIEQRSISATQYSLTRTVTANGESHVTEFIRVEGKRYQRLDRGKWQSVTVEPDRSGKRAEPMAFAYFLTESVKNGEAVRKYRREDAGSGPVGFNETIEVDSKGRVVRETYNSRFGHGSITYQFPENIDSITEPELARIN